MIPSTTSNHHLEGGDQPNPGFSKVTSDPKSEGRYKRKKNKTRDKTQVENGDTEKVNDRIAADPDAMEGTSSAADQH